MISIKTPIWSTKSIGIAERSLLYGDNFVEITYTDKQGNRIYPNTFIIDRDKAFTYPQQILPSGVKLRIIPINDLEVYEN